MVNYLNNKTTTSIRKTLASFFTLELSIILGLAYYEYYKLAAAFFVAEIASYALVRSRKSLLKEGVTQYIDTVYISDDGETLTVTSYPHDNNEKNVYFMKMKDTRFRKFSRADVGMDSKDLFITDGVTKLIAKIDERFELEKMSPGVLVFAEDLEGESEKWVNENIVLKKKDKEEAGDN